MKKLVKKATTFLLVMVFLSSGFWGLVGCGPNPSFFDASILSDTVQDGVFVLTEEVLSELERSFASGAGCSRGVHTEMPNFREDLKITIEGYNITIDNNTISFIRTGNYYIGRRNDEGSIYFSLDGKILNARLREFIFRERDLQFERKK